MFSSHPAYMEDIERVSRLSCIPWERLYGKKILISGANGMVGCFLTDVLMAHNTYREGNIQIIAMSRTVSTAKKRFAAYWEEPLFLFAQQDVNMPFQSDFRADFIIHAASNTHPVAYAQEPVETILTNVRGTENLLRCAVSSEAERVAFLSSVEVYGENTGAVERFSEQDAGYIDCNTLRAGYPESKRVGEALCCAFAKQYGLQIVLPRLCRLYGPTMLPGDSKASSQFIKNAVNGQDIVLKSAGTQKYSYCYVADAVTAVLMILLCGEAGEAYNIADPASDITLRALAETISGIVGKEVIFQLPDTVESAGFSKATIATLNPEKLNALGWTAAETMRSGISKTISILKASQ